MGESINKVTGNEIAALLVPSAVALITARAADKSDKVATIAWVMPISHEPSYIAVAIRPAGQTACAIAKSGGFIVNVLPSTDDAANAATICGTKQGIDDRFAQAHLEVSEGKHIAAARINQAISWIECELVDSHQYGDHQLFIGKTLCATTKGALSEHGKVVPQPVLLAGQRMCFGHFEEGFEEN